jgi:hypothetical protein
MASLLLTGGKIATTLTKENAAKHNSEQVDIF